MPVEFEVAVEDMDIGRVFCEARQACAHWLQLHQKVFAYRMSKAKTYNQDDNEGESNNATANTTASFYRKGFWTVLTQEHGVKHPLLLALIFYYIERGSRQAEFRYFQSFNGTNNKMSHRLESTAAASLYFTFLGMPGSGAFKIFHPLLFTKALDVFKVRNVSNHLHGKTSCGSNFKVVALFKAARSSPSRQKGRRQVQTNTSKFFFVD